MSLSDSLSILDFARDERLMNFKPWPAQEVILRALYAMPMPPELLPLWHQMTESERPYEPRRYRAAYLVIGRQSGKNCMTTVAAGYEAICRDYAALLPGHRFAQCTVVATRLEQVRDEFISRLALDIQGSDALDPLLVKYDNKPEPGKRTSNKDQLVFTNRSIVRGMPCSAKAVRGASTFMGVFDEACHYSRELGSARGDLEVVRAVRPSMRVFKNVGLGLEIYITTPQAKEGVVWEAYDKREERRDWQLTMRVPTWLMDPNWNESEMAIERETDPLGFAIEYGAEFAEMIAGLFLREEVDAVLHRRGPYPAAPGKVYWGRIDPAFVRDRFGIGVGHADGDWCKVDHLEAVSPPKGAAINLQAVLERIRQLHQSYGVRKWITDQYAGEPIAQLLRGSGIPVEVQPWGSGYKHTIYSTFVQKVRAQRIDMPWSAILDRELIRLQQRTGKSGNVTIGHPAASGETDDLADVCAGLAQDCARGAEEVERGDMLTRGHCRRCLRPLPRRAGRAALYCRECRAGVTREQNRIRQARRRARRRCRECHGRLTRYSRGGYCVRCLRAAAERIASIGQPLQENLY
jgi:hypothetical protein